MQTHEYFPGGNTPQGFYSYYDYILPQEEAKKIIVLKGGPGTGKSSLMKKVAALLNENGYETDLLHCSSDPDSLDAIVSRELGFCMLDGTAPHRVDPIHPGCTDTILHLGDYWDASGIQKHKDNIMLLTKSISESFSDAYDYLKAAGSVQNYIRKAEKKRTDEERLTARLNDLIADLKLSRSDFKRGKIKKAFLSALTPKGSIGYIDSFAAGAARTIVLDADADTSALFANRLATCIEHSGKDAYFFYCPMQPETKIEHIYLPEEHLLITTANSFHKCNTSAEHIDLNIYTAPTSALRADTDILNILLSRAIACIRAAKAMHDELEQFYIPYMHFDAMADLPNKIVSEIL